MNIIDQMLKQYTIESESVSINMTFMVRTGGFEPPHT
jgi:hypothetical protein